MTRPNPEAPHSRLFPIAVIIFAALIFFPARVVQEANTTWRLSSWVMAIGSVSITLSGIYLSGGARWLRHFSFPIYFFLVAVPWPTGLEIVVIQNLTQLNVAATVEALALRGIPAMQQGNVIEISSGLVGIDEACSGIRSLQATLMIALFLGEMYRFSTVRRVILIAAGVGLAFIFNVVRTFVLVSVAARDGIAAIAKWHDPAGVTILVACFLALWGVALLLRGKSGLPATVKSVPQAQSLPKFILVGLAAWMAFVENGTEFWYRAHESSTFASSQWSVRWPTEKSQFRRLDPFPKEVHEIMNFDEGQAAHWLNGDGTDWYAIYFRWNAARSLSQRVKVQAAKNHRPDICLRATGMTLQEDFGIGSMKVGKVEFIFRRYRFEDHGVPLYVFYFASEDGSLRQSPTNLRENTAARLAAAWAGTRGLGQRMLEFIISGASNEPQAEELLKRELPRLIQD